MNTEEIKKKAKYLTDIFLPNGNRLEITSVMDAKASAKKHCKEVISICTKNGWAEDVITYAAVLEELNTNNL